MAYKSKRKWRKQRSESSISSTSDVPAQLSPSQQMRTSRPRYLQLIHDGLSWLTRSKRSPHASSSYKSTVSNAGLPAPHKVVSKLSTPGERLRSSCTQTRGRSKRADARRGQRRRKNRATRRRGSRRVMTRKGRSRHRRKATSYSYRGGKSRKRRGIRRARYPSSRRTARRANRSKVMRENRYKSIKTNRSKIIMANRRNVMKRKQGEPAQRNDVRHE